ncbi:hypothetical protein ONZ45_g12706 [Pleurotus djamor]|nr:hypothetical protein ONZ45_g12706 [Pleurotus djamor]
MASTKLTKYLTQDHVYTPYEFDESTLRDANFKRFIYNGRRGEIANNETVGYYGRSIHSLATRITSTRFVTEDAGFDPSKSKWAIEYLTFALTQPETMARAMASGVDLKIVQLDPEEKAQIRAWFTSKQGGCPKMLADLMQAQSWGIDACAGFDAVIDHTYNNLFAAFHVGLEDFEIQWRLLGEQGFLEETQARWIREHNYPLNTVHVADFTRRFDLIDDESLQHSFGMLRGLFPPSDHSSVFDSNGVLHQRFINLAHLGFAVLDCFFGKEVDSIYVRHRASISGGVYFGMTLRGIVLCDESLAYIAEKIGICDFQPNCDHQAKAQALSTAVGRFWVDNPASVEWDLSLPIGILVRMAYQVVRELDSDLLPRMSTITPYPMVPLPYHDDTPSSFQRDLSQNQASPSPSSLPSPSPPPPSSPSPPSSPPPIVVISHVERSQGSAGAQQTSTSAPTATISSSPMNTDASTSATNAESESATEVIIGSSSKGFLPSFKLLSLSGPAPGSGGGSSTSSSAYRPSSDKSESQSAAQWKRWLKNAKAPLRR